jgi:general secretion pathway protein K
MRDETARIDLNTASDDLLKGLLLSNGLDEEQANQVLDAILDWRDADELVRPQGAERDQYEAMGKPYIPANMEFRTVAELQSVIGVTPDLYRKLAGALTVYSRQAGINPATASREVLLSIPGVGAEQVEAFLVQRQEALLAKLPVPAFVQAQSFGAGAIPVWAIRAEARLPDGVTFVRDAVLRPSADPMRPVVAYGWQDGVLPPRTETGAGNPASPNNGTNIR